MVYYTNAQINRAGTYECLSFEQKEDTSEICIYYSTSERWQALSLLYTALLWHRTSGFAVSPEERQHLFAFYDKQGVLMIYSHPDPKGLAIWSFKTQNKYGQWWAITFNGSRALVRDTRVFSQNIIFVQYHSSIALLLIHLRDEYMYK